MAETFISRAAKQDFHDLNRASEVLGKIGGGTLDADFARSIGKCIDRVTETEKRCKVVVIIEMEPSENGSAMIVRGEIVEKFAKLRPPISTMHVSEGGGLITQTDFLVGGGRDESRAPIVVEARPASARLQVVAARAPSQAIEPSAPAPVADGKSTAAGDKPAT